MRTIALVLAVIAAVNAGSIGYEDCGSVADIGDVRVDGCDQSPCVFIKGQTYGVELDGSGNANTPTTNTLPYKLSARVIVDITIKEGNACDELIAGSCPATPDDSFSFRTEVDVLQIYPAVETTVTAQVWGDDGNTLICIKVPVIIQNA